MEWCVVDRKVSDGSSSFSNLAIGIDMNLGRIVRYGEFSELCDSLNRLRCSLSSMGSQYEDISIFNLSRNRSAKRVCIIANALFKAETEGKVEINNVIKFYKISKSRLSASSNSGKIVFEDYAERGFTVKCPMPYYYATCGLYGSEEPTVVAFNKRKTLEEYRREVLSYGAKYTEKGIFDKKLYDLLSSITLACSELSFYPPEYQIYQLKTNNGINLEKRDIEDKIMMLRNTGKL